VKGKTVKIPVPGMQGRLGLGTAIKRATERVGIKGEDCGCKDRADTLDRKAEFVGWKEWRGR